MMVNQGETQVNRQQLETLDSQFNTRHSMFENEYGEKMKLTEVGRFFFSSNKCRIIGSMQSMQSWVYYRLKKKK